MKKKRKGTFFSTKGKISVGDWGKISGEMRVLDAPILRVASMDTPIPFNKKLEDQFMPNEELAEAVEKILKY